MGTKQTFLYLGKKASVVSSLAFLLLLAQPCAANDSSVSVALPLVSNNCVSQDSVTTANPYCQANIMYEEAMALSDKAQRTEKLNAAVETINSYLIDCPNSVKGLVLASEIYRARGGRSYAIQYNEKAKNILKKYIIESNDMHAMLDYAILCSAGDDRYTAESDDSRELGKKQAEIIVQLCQKQLNDNTDKEVKQKLSETLAIAHLVLGNKKQCNEYLKMSSSSWLDVFENTVLKETWLWPVSRADNVEKEFLLYYLKSSD